MIGDGIDWLLNWLGDTFDFLKPLTDALVDIEFVKIIRDAVFGAIDFVKKLFQFKPDAWQALLSGVLKGFKSVMDILFYPIDLAIDAILQIFDFKKPGDKDFKISDLVMDAIATVIDMFKSILDIDFTSMLKKIPGAGMVMDLLKGDGPETKEDIQKQIKELEEDVANDSWLESKANRREDKEELERLKAKLAKMATGGTILPGGAAIVGEGSMAGEMVINANSAAKVIPAKQTADIMSGIGGGGPSIAPTTIVNSSSSPVTTYANSSSHNPYSDKYFRN